MPLKDLTPGKCFINIGCYSKESACNYPNWDASETKGPVITSIAEAQPRAVPGAELLGSLEPAWRRVLPSPGFSFLAVLLPILTVYRDLT